MTHSVVGGFEGQGHRSKLWSRLVLKIEGKVVKPVTAPWAKSMPELEQPAKNSQLVKKLLKCSLKPQVKAFSLLMVYLYSNTGIT